MTKSASGTPVGIQADLSDEDTEVRTPNRPGPAAKRSARRRSPMGAGADLAGHVFLSPWLIGFGLITLVPMAVSLYLSFTDYNLFTSPEWVGLANYKRMIDDPRWMHSVVVTAMYVAISVPLKLAVALGVAVILNRIRRGSGLLRALFYLPSLLGATVAVAVTWQALFSGRGGVNGFLENIGITGRDWVNDPSFVLYAIILLAVWQFGAPMVIFLAGLKQIPGEILEAADIDGAGPVRRFFQVVLPLLTPVLFFNLLLEIVNAFQAFTPALVIGDGQGGPSDSTLFYTVYLYQRGFGNFQMGYASAMAWAMLLALGVITVLLFRSSRSWVFYQDSGRDPS
ncbi:carbohydrate ABC transporter permease [Phytohabitans kaempferiae]|uniref:Carbohydrate ABC transporter permease n=1 Tax=Phytohabitans kaempferiae TaxID=1620943 RepID=A0ABV6MBA3_9ACTN